MCHLTRHSLAEPSASRQTRLLRGADSVYVAVAEAYDAILVTWDVEMLERGSELVKTMTPLAWMEKLRSCGVGAIRAQAVLK